MRPGVDEKRGCGSAAWGTGRIHTPPTARQAQGRPAPSLGPSGFLAGICGVAVGYPLDTVKVRQQPGPSRPAEAPAPTQATL